MKTKLLTLGALALLSTLNPQLPAAPVGPAFTYQGKLADGGNPAQGIYDLRFALYDALAGGTQVGSSLTNAATSVTNGYFTVTLDFGAVFAGNARWLEIGVRTNGSGAFATLAPRQPLTPSPYALYAPSAGAAATATTASSANSVAAANVTGALGLAQLPAAVVTNNQSGVTFTGTFTGNGAGLTNIPFTALPTVPLTNNQSGVTLKGLTTVSNLSVTATNFVNYLVVTNPPALNGSAITNLNAAQITGTISSNNIAAGTISGAMLANGAVGSNQLAAAAVTTGALANGAVTAAKVATVSNWFLALTIANPTPAPSDSFAGSMAAVGSDRVVIGAVGDNMGANDAGAAYLFSTNGTLLTTFTNPAPATEDAFGCSVAALGSDRVLIGAYDHETGAAYLFSTNGTLLTTFTNPTPANSDYFGYSVAVVGSTRVLIGAHQDDTGATDAGAAYLFSTNGTLLTTFTNPTPQTNDYFGVSVAAVGGNRVLIGAFGHNTGASAVGAAYLFSTNGTLLTTFTNPTPADGEGFGYSVAAVGTDRVLIGTPGDSTGATNAGAAYLFSTNGTLLTTFTNPTPADSDMFGTSLAAVGTDRVLIGTPGDSTGATDAGAAYLFSTNGTLLATFTNPTPADNEYFGASLAVIGSDGVLIGTSGDSTGAPYAGASYLFSLENYTPGLVADGVNAGSIATVSLSDGAVTAAKIGGVLLASQIPDLDASKLTTGTLSLAQLPSSVVTNNASGVTLSGTFSGNGAGLTNIPLASLSSVPLTNNQSGVAFKGLTTVSNLSVTATNFVNYLVVTNPPALNGSAITHLNASQLTTGTLPLVQLPAAVVTNNATGLNLSGTFSGNGAGVTNLNASQLASGTVADARLSANVALRNANQSFTGTNLFAQPVGIGTTNPGQLLQVGDATLAGSQGMIRLGSRSPTNTNYRTWDIGVPQTGGDTTGIGYSFVINDTLLGTTPQFIIRYGTGYVGIGKTNPATALDVNGTVTATGFAGNGAGLLNLAASQLTGIIPLTRLPDAVVTNNETGLNLAGTFAGNGAGLTNIPFTALPALPLTNNQDGVTLKGLTTVNTLTVMGDLSLVAATPVPLEGFEGAVFPPAGWVTGGTVSWVRTTNAFTEGAASAAFGPVPGISSSTYLQFTCAVPASAVLQFDWKVNSELGMSFLHVLVDGTYQDGIAGSIGWTPVALPLSAGSHTIRWYFEQWDDYVPGNGWLDNVRVTLTSGTVRATAFVGDGSGLTNLDAAHLTGTLPDARLSTNVALLNANQTFTGSNRFAGVLTLTNAANTIAGTFTGSNRFAGVVTMTNVANTFAGTFTGNAAGLTNLDATDLTGTVPDARLSANVPLINGTNTFTGTNKFTGEVTVNGALYGSAPYLKYAEVTTGTTQGGTANAGTNNWREFNTEIADTHNLGSLSSGDIILPPGTYQCRISAPAYGVSSHQARLRTSTGTTLIYGTTAYSGAAAANDRSLIEGQFTLASTTTLRVQHWCFSNNAVNGLGALDNNANIWGDAANYNIFATAEFWKTK